MTEVLPAMMAVYRELAGGSADARAIAIMGDSAGGGMALALAQRLAPLSIFIGTRDVFLADARHLEARASS